MPVTSNYPHQQPRISEKRHAYPMSCFFISIGPSMTDTCTILHVKGQRLSGT